MPGFAQPGPGRDPDLTETAILPPTEGPPLVRPYVPSVPVEEHLDPYAPTPATPYAQAPSDPYAQAPADPFATTVLPPVPADPYAQAPVDPYAPTPAAPYAQAPAPADPYATAVLPPIGADTPPPPPLMPQAPPSALPPRELGLFPIADSQDGARGRAAARRARRRRTGVIAATGGSMVALGVGLAFVLSPGSSGGQALPVLPTGAASPSPSGQSTDSTAPPSSAAPSSATPSATTPRPTAPRTTAAPHTTAPPPATTQAAPPPRPTTQAPQPSTAPPTTAPPSPTLPVPGEHSAAVVALQQQLRSAGCGGAHSGTYDGRTANEVAMFQLNNNINTDQPGVLDQQTEDSLAAGNTC